jgi:hypothetical protein
MVGGISRSGTRRRNFSQAVVGANEPMPRVSKKLTIAPRTTDSSVGAARAAMAARTRKKVKNAMARPSGTRSATSIGPSFARDARPSRGRHNRAGEIFAALLTLRAGSAI